MNTLMSPFESKRLYALRLASRVLTSSVGQVVPSTAEDGVGVATGFEPLLDGSRADAPSATWLVARRARSAVGTEALEEGIRRRIRRRSDIIGFNRAAWIEAG